MKLVPLDFGAEKRDLEIYAPLGSGSYYEVECPFCQMRNLVYYRNFARGVRCGNRECRAMLYHPHCATRDLMPKNETVLVHGLRTSAAVAERLKGNGVERRGDF